MTALSAFLTTTDLRRLEVRLGRKPGELAARFPDGEYLLNIRAALTDREYSCAYQWLETRISRRGNQ